MATKLGQTESNQQIFDSFIRSVLDDCGVRRLDLPTEDLLDSIEKDQASIDAVLNLIVVAHAIYLFSTISTPIDDPTWTNDLHMQRSRVARALGKCREILGKSRVNSERRKDDPASTRSHWWHIVVPIEYKLPPWEEFKDSGLLTSPKVAECPFLRDLRLMTPWPPDYPRSLAFERDLVQYGESTPLTSWHYFAINDRINGLADRIELIEFDEWMTAVDVCSQLICRTEPLKAEFREAMLEQSWSYRSSAIRATPTSAEHWSWQFGRIAALGLIRENTVGITPTEYFDWHWPNGLKALSLICTAQQPYDALVESCWHGVLFSESSSSAEMHLEGAAQIPSSHLYWLMRLGFLDGVKRIEGHKVDGPAHSMEPSQMSTLLIGSPQELARELVAAEEAARKERVAQIESTLAGHLGKVWELLPADSQQQLSEGELRRQWHNGKEASLCYANAVETALREWLSNPEGRRDWPRGIGEWMDCIRRMTLPRDKRHKLDHVLRRRFNADYAKELANALDVFQRSRLPGAHGLPLPPFTVKARETALGNEQRSSVFDLLLRFAKRVPSP